MAEKKELLPSLEPTSSKKSTKTALPWLPASWRPYGELMRLHKPVGILNIYFPYLFGCLLAGCVESLAIKPFQLFTACAQMFLAAFILRSMGCAWNDIIDRDLDKQTERCKGRPMARGAISVPKALAFTFVLFLVWIWILQQIATPAAILYAIPVPFLTAFYPFAKTITNFAQLVLGVTLSLGAFVGAAQLDLDVAKAFSSPEYRSCTYGLISLFIAYVVFSLVHDTIYAFQDVKDDKQTGAMSMAVLFSNSSVPLLAGLSVLQVGSLAAVGSFLSYGYGWYFITCGCVGTLYGIMLHELDVERPDRCWLWFKLTSVGFGVLVALGFIWQYAFAI